MQKANYVCVYLYRVVTFKQFNPGEGTLWLDNRSLLVIESEFDQGHLRKAVLAVAAFRHRREN